MSNKSQLWLISTGSTLLKQLCSGIGGLAGLALAFAPIDAWATTYGPNFCLNSTGADCVLQLDMGDTSISPYPGPYVNIDVSIANSGHSLQFDLTSDTQTSGGTTYKYLFDNVALYLEQASHISGGTFISSSKDFGGYQPVSSDVTFGGAINEDGFGGGSFGTNSVVVSGPKGGFNLGLTSLVFDINWDSTVTWSNLFTQQFMYLGSTQSDCEVGGAQGCSAAGHVYVLSTTTSPPPSNLSSWSQVATGFGGWPDACDQGKGTGCSNTTITAAPEPTSLAVLGTALVGFGIFHCRRRRTMA